MGYLCNKITLQPLIENAIVHGLDMSDEGEILIEVFEQEQDIIMRVCDIFLPDHKLNKTNIKTFNPLIRKIIIFEKIYNPFYIWVNIIMYLDV